MSQYVLLGGRHLCMYHFVPMLHFPPVQLVHFWLCHTVHLCMGFVQGAVHMVAARLGCKAVVVGTRMANSHPGSINGHRKHRKRYSYLVGGLFVLGKTIFVLNQYLLLAENTDYCMFVNK